MKLAELAPFISVTKLTNVGLLRDANSYTTGKPSKMTLEAAYRHGHSTIRTQIFKVEFQDIPLCVASHLVRHTQGVSWYQCSRRPDRGGRNFEADCKLLSKQMQKALSEDNEDDMAAYLGDLENVFPRQFDRYAKTDLMCIINAEALMNIARKRLCGKASPETRLTMQLLREEIEHVDPALAAHMVPTCVYRGGICPEPNSCGYNELHKLEQSQNQDPNQQ